MIIRTISLQIGRPMETVAAHICFEVLFQLEPEVTE
jgi:hypothetical protein